MDVIRSEESRLFLVLKLKLNLAKGELFRGTGWHEESKRVSRACSSSFVGLRRGATRMCVFFKSLLIILLFPIILIIMVLGILLAIILFPCWCIGRVCRFA